MTLMLKDVDKRLARTTFRRPLIITAFRATMLLAVNFSSNAVRPFQVFDQIICQTRMSRGGFGSGVPTPMGSRFSRPKARRNGVKSVVYKGVDRYGFNTAGRSGFSS